MKDSRKILKRHVDELPPNTEIWDGELRGFGARRQNSDAITYQVLYRTKEGKQRRVKIGRHGPLTPDEARKEARGILADATKGLDPAAERKRQKNLPTVSDLCDQYVADASAGRLLVARGAAKKASTLLTDRSRIERHIKPLLGKLAVASVTRAAVEAFMHDVAGGKSAAEKSKRGGPNVTGGKGAASRTLGLLGAIFTYAVKAGLRSDNPVHGVLRYRYERRERRLTDDEFAALGRGLKLSEANLWPPAVAAARFIALTGWRRGEVLGLRRSEVNLERRTATLADTKTGRSLRPLSRAACEVLRERLRDQPEGSDYVFTAQRGKGAMSPQFWRDIVKLSGLPDDVTPHVLRHSFSSVAGDMEYGEPTIAALIGHAGRSMTSRYVHSADAVLLAAADRIADHIVALMDAGLTQGAETEGEPAIYNAISP